MRRGGLKESEVSCPQSKDKKKKGKEKDDNEMTQETRGKVVTTKSATHTSASTTLTLRTQPQQNTATNFVAKARGTPARPSQADRVVMPFPQAQLNDHIYLHRTLDIPSLLYSLSIALYILLSLIRRRPSCCDTNTPTTSATSCAIHRSKTTDTVTFMIAADNSINRADIGIGMSSRSAAINFVGASKTETLNSESATRDTMSHPRQIFQY